ncbi:ArsR family transcriptional regulator [Kitasatospora sp. MMS16-BH015]|uniref:helix-turn-helix domain-containing protein n=1 Tax=Kitasatospora sp. MMS16-BH015 TaxID=2018025 RepID=UPI000CA36717|nr:helix-turn-helix domain-containing protein [Kitasatospora sp. MMS16-BH015]AUG77097.1 ArsR family transcriptional regulator [Kitasatospora sp. MMS16-BH015]
MNTEERSKRRLDARALRGLAHPLRVRILEELAAGPATSARLAERLGENTGTVSWHLRHLAEHGFIEEEAGLGTKRERWWRRVRQQEVLATRDFADDPAAKAVADAYLRELMEVQARRVAESLAAEWTGEWLGAGSMSDWGNLRLTAAQLKALHEELTAVVERYQQAAAEPESAARPVFVQIRAMPRAGEQ